MAIELGNCKIVELLLTRQDIDVNIKKIIDQAFFLYDS